MGDCEALATRDRIQEISPSFFSRENSERVEGRLRSIPYERSHSVSPPVPSQGKILNVLKGDCEAFSMGDCAALPLGDCEALATRDRIQGSPCFFSRENFEGVIGKR